MYIVGAALNWVVWFLSGEWLLKWWSNGGLTVLLRALWSSVFLYAASLALWEISDPHSIARFSWSALRSAVNETVPWLGALFGATYAALYARFASQWRYMADLYNSIMAAQVSGVSANGARQRSLANWKAAYVEDLEDLHLISKPMYAQLAKDLLEDEQVRSQFRKCTLGGRARLAEIDRVINKAIRRERLRLARKIRRLRRRRISR